MFRLVPGRHDILIAKTPDDHTAGEDIYPVPTKEEYKVDFYFNHRRKPLYLFGVAGVSKARLTTISVRYFHDMEIDFRSIAVLAEVDSIPPRDRSRLADAVDSVYLSLLDFEEDAVRLLETMQ